MPARLDFKAIAENTDIYEVAKYLNLTIVKDRATCPACDSERSLQFYPQTNTFYCHSAEKGSDCISLVAHIKGYSGQYPAAKELAEQFAMPNGTQEVRTAPQKPQGRTEKSQPSRAPFDAEKFAEKLEYASDTEKLLLIGVYKNRTYHGHRYPSGVIAGFSYLQNGELVPPKTWLPDVAPNIVPFKRPA